MFNNKNIEKGSILAEKRYQHHRRERSYSTSSSVEKKNKKYEKVNRKNKFSEKTKYSRSNSSSSESYQSPKKNKNEVVVKGINFSADEESIQQFLEKKFGKITKMNLLKDFQGNSKGLAFVGFSNEDSTLKALKFGTCIEFMGRNIIIEKPIDRRQNRNNEEDANTVFVGNLSYKTDSNDIKDFFSNCGSILNCRIAFLNGKSRGFCHVQFAEKQSLIKALKKDGMQLDGRQLKINLANNYTKPRLDGKKDSQRNQSSQKYNSRKYERKDSDSSDDEKYRSRK